MIRCIAIDDEPLALAQIERYAARIPDLELVGAFYSVEQAQEILSGEKIDLMFLDIEMPDANGVDFARRLGDSSPYIIFTTAYPQYAVDGFRLDAIDYLLKPLSIDDMLVAVDKVKRRMTAESRETGTAERHLYVKVSGVVRKVSYDDLLYVRSLGEYVQLCVRNENGLLTTFDSIKRLEQQLPADCFMRIHKSFMINLDAIQQATRQTVTVNGETLPIGEKYRSAFLRFLKGKL